MSSIYFPFKFKLPLISILLDTSLPDKKFRKVVLPQPEGPNIAVNFPGFKVPERLLRRVFFSVIVTFLVPY